ncbi:TIR domain-containing protein [Kovacikia minuta CCNUW1]|uniref:TIR domain-containing protein n=1 Tax=Kovacikia minuta TaxID=2931930 RepID=UPI001CCDCD96|nr:TIR domain-containing protein [Kovacikia minuta]UBF28527.1 TIR domain-containing protein [Kovacikia minuta CCNUW1]
MTSAMVIDLAQRRVNDFQHRCGEYGEAALHLAYHAALPVALNAELLHLLRINFFLDPPEVLPYTVEFEFLLSPLCREIDEGLYEIEPEIRDTLLAGLTQEYDTQRIQDIATLLWQYTDRRSPWADRVELERAQQLTALNFLNPEKAQQWLTTVETEVAQGQVAAREWYVAMQKDVEKQVQLHQTSKQSIDEIPSEANQANTNLQQVLIASLRSLSNSQEWTVQGDVMRIGRSPDNDLVLPEDASGVSRQHAEISHRSSAENGKQSVYFFRDFSRFGTWMLIPEAEEWQRIHQQEILLLSGTQLKFGSSKNSALEFSITEIEGVRNLREVFKQFQGSLEDGRKAAAWLDENRTQLAETGGRLALEQFLNVKEVASPEQVDNFYFSIEQFLEQISHSLTWGSYDILDEPGIPIVFENEVYETALKKIKKRLSPQLNGDAQKQLTNCIDYLIEVLGRVEERIEEDQNESSISSEATLRDLRRTIPSNPQPAQVFISYARKDQVFYNQLVKHLSVLRLERVIAAWHDRCSLSANEQDEQLDPFLESADIILFLISADFLASNTSNREVTRAIERQKAGEARVIPIILRSVDLKDSPLSKLQFLPKDGKPVSKWANQDEAFLDVAQGIRKATEQMAVRAHPASNKASIMRRKMLEKQLSSLEEDYSALTERLQFVTNMSDRLRLQRQIEAITREINTVTMAIEKVASNVAKSK